MTPAQTAMLVLMGRCERVQWNVMQSGTCGRTKPTEWQPVIWLEKQDADTPLSRA